MPQEPKQRPIVIAHHLIWTIYGWWLPNDPRGSTSRRIASDAIATLGELHYGRKRVQPSGRVVREFHERAKEVLLHEYRTLSNKDIKEVASGFVDAIEHNRYTCYACAIMPDHVHLIIRKHKHHAEEMIGILQKVSRGRVLALHRRDCRHPIWTEGGWKGFLDRPNAVRRVIGYIEQNPVKIGRPVQRWPFVTEYNNWPFHAGHSPNSPYAKRLRAHLEDHPD